MNKIPNTLSKTASHEPNMICRRAPLESAAVAEYQNKSKAQVAMDGSLIIQSSLCMDRTLKRKETNVHSTSRQCLQWCTLA